MRKTYILLVLLHCYSCDFFNAKKTTTEAILKEELETFNWIDVDSYPTFDVCNKEANQDEKKQCFEQTLSRKITQYLEQQIIVVTTDVNDTLQLKLHATSKGHLQLEAIKMDTLTQQQIPQIETLIQQSIKTLPKLYPALKRGQQVNTRFELPLIIKVK